MTNCRHLICSLVVQKIIAWLKWTTVFTVTTECISQNGSETWKFGLQPGIIIIANSQNQTSFFRRNWDSFFLFDMATPPRKKFLIKLTRRNADGQNVHHQRVNQTVQAVHPCERCRPTLLSCRLPLSVQKQNFSSVVARSPGVCVTEDSSVKTKRGKLSVEMTDQPFVTKWTMCLQTRCSFFLPVRRPQWLRKHSFSTAQVCVMIGSPSSALSITEEGRRRTFLRHVNRLRLTVETP